MIEESTAWYFIRENAKKALVTNMVYHSLVEKKAYKVLSVHAEKIVIARASGGEDQELTKRKVITAIKKFNATGGEIKRRTLISPTVAEETAFVLFHPNLAWDDQGTFIIEV